MKKALILAAAALLCLCSCHKQEVTYNEGIQLENILINVPQNAWNYTNDDNNNYFFASVDMPEITENVFDNALIKVYRTYNFDSSNPTQIELPYVRSFERYWPDEDAWEFYTESVDYEYGIGTMSFFFTMSNFDYELDESLIPEQMQFRCVIAY